MPEWSKGFDSSSNGFGRAGSNPAVRSSIHQYYPLSALVLFQYRRGSPVSHEIIFFGVVSYKHVSEEEISQEISEEEISQEISEVEWSKTDFEKTIHEKVSRPFLFQPFSEKDI